jgi:peptidylprolyl isomerase
MRSYHPIAIVLMGTVLAHCAAGPAKAPASGTATGAAHASANTPAPDDPRVEKLARILRASDRRVPDEDLRALLADGDASIRAKAVLALAQIGGPGMGRAVAHAATDPSPKVRAAAAFGLGLLAEPATNVDALSLALDANGAVRAAAMEALGRLHEPASLTTLRAGLSDPDESVRVAAGLAAWKLPEPDGLLDGLIENLRSDRPAVRASAAYALARITSATVVPPTSGAAVGRVPEARRALARSALATRVADTEPEVRMQVARGLSSPQGPDEMAVVGSLSGDREARVRVAAVRAMAFPGVPIMPYLDRATTDRDLAVGRTAMESLGKVGGTMAAEKLGSLFIKLSGTFLREACLTSLVQVKPDLAESVVEGLLQNPDPVMRAAAVPLLIGRKESWAITATIFLLGDKEPRVVAAAISQVAEMDGALAKQLDPFFRATDPVVRAAAAEAVGTRLATPRAAVESRADLYRQLDVVWEASTKDTLADAKLSVLDAAAKGGRDEATRAVFERGLTDRDVLVRRRAAAKYQDVFAEDKSSLIGPYADRPFEDYLAMARWAQRRHAAVVTMQRSGTLPGKFVVALDADAAPMAAWNFAQLAEKKFFDNRIIHRMVPNFVVQDGDPRGDGWGGPGYSIRDEYNPLAYEAGVLGMASDGKDTAGSQWFVVLSAQPHLDGRYTSFGRVTQGFRQIVEQILPGDSVVSIRVYEGDGTEPPADR